MTQLTKMQETESDTPMGGIPESAKASTSDGQGKEDPPEKGDGLSDYPDDGSESPDGDVDGQRQPQKPDGEGNDERRSQKPPGIPQKLLDNAIPIRSNDRNAATFIPVVSLSKVNKIGGRAAYINRYGPEEAPRYLIQHSYHEGGWNDPKCDLRPGEELSRASNQAGVKHKLAWNNIRAILAVAWCYTDAEMLSPKGFKLGQNESVYVLAAWSKESDDLHVDWFPRHWLRMNYSDPESNAGLHRKAAKLCGNDPEGLMYQHIDSLIYQKAKAQEELHKAWVKERTGSSPEPVLRSSVTPDPPVIGSIEPIDESQGQSTQPVTSQNAVAIRSSRTPSQPPMMREKTPLELVTEHQEQRAARARQDDEYAEDERKDNGPAPTPSDVSFLQRSGRWLAREVAKEMRRVRLN